MSALNITRGLSNAAAKSFHSCGVNVVHRWHNGSNRSLEPRFYNSKCFKVLTIRCIHSAVPHRQSNKLEQASVTRDPNFSVPPHVDARLSYAYGRSNRELKYCTLAPMIDAMAEREPQSTAVIVYDEGINKSFEQLNSDINKLVNGMIHKLNLKRGDRVGVYSYNNYQFLLIQFACHKLGLMLNTINPSYKAHEFSYVMEKADVKLLFTPGRNSKQSSLNDNWSVVCDKSLAQLQSNGKLSSLETIVILDGDYEDKDLNMVNVNTCRWRSVFTNDSKLDPIAQERIDQVRSDDVYGIYYTSGTTGFPKGATITQFNVINNVALSCDRVFNQRGPHFKSMRPNVCLPLPLFHEFAGVLGILLPFINGGSVVLPGMRYNIQSVVESIIRFKCNAIFLTPTILIDLLGYIESKKLSDIPLRSMLVAGSPVISELVNKTHKMLPDLEELRIGYGSSENGVIATIQTSQEPIENRPYTVGPPLDFTEIRIADVNTDETTLIGQSGEVQTRGFNTMLHYLNEPEKTAEVLTPSRWYKTGDLGILDRNGSLQIVGRMRDLIIKGGENIYPAEVETVLHTHQAVEDAHVIGVPDKRLGEEVCAWVKLHPSKRNTNEEEMKKDIIEFCKKRLTYFKVPKYVLFVEEFPLTPVKKIKKYEMRAQTAKLLNLDR